MSYILWGASPDWELMRAAEAGDLAKVENVEAQVKRMLADPRAIDRSARFLHEWLNLDRLANLRPNPDRFPAWDKRLASDMVEETLAFFREVAWVQQRPLWDLMNAQVTYATPRLAEHYGLDRRPAVTSEDTADTAGEPDTLAESVARKAAKRARGSEPALLVHLAAPIEQSEDREACKPCMYSMKARAIWFAMSRAMTPRSI